MVATPPSADSEHYIRCARLTKVFKDFWMRNRVTAVNEIDLDVRRGEVFGLLGPNGSGKSTTIKMILGLLHPSSGVISVFGKTPRDVSIKHDIGYLPEESYLYRFLNARETLDYYGKLFHQDRRKRQNRIDMLLEMVGLDKVQRRPIGEYSKGMQRRIGLAQALINDPKLLILDEPTTGMDPIGTRQIKDLIVQLKESGKTVLLCSHLLSDVEDVTDRAAIMFGGKVRRAGSIDDLLVRHDETTLTTPALSEAETEKMLQLLGKAGVHDVKVTQGRQRLESLFLEIVESAQREGVATAGAGNAGAVAAFLTESHTETDGQAKERGTSQVIDDLLSPATVQPSTAPLPSNKPIAAPVQKERVLEELTAPAPVAKPAAKPTTKPSNSSSARPETPNDAPSSAAPPTPPAAADQSILDDLMN
ncbi:MAG: ABC transporter ATP-binding protein [Algisphaera sp.]